MQSKEEIKDILLKTLKKVWGYDGFRDSQEDIIFSIIERRDTLALLPTGGGKSICYQLPALVLDGVCIVISPLLALMKDQVFLLKSIGIEAEYLSAELDENEQEVIYEKAINGDIKLLYVSPERLVNSLFLRKIIDVGLSFIAVDEAHCISEWGQDFRPSYQNIKNFRKIIGDIPCIALTATATSRVVQDIQSKLEMKNVNIFQKSYKRDNLGIFIEEISNKYQSVFDFLKFNPVSGIVYVRTRKDAEMLSQFLKQKGLQNVDYYHAGLSSKIKTEKQYAWQMSHNKVLISTNAFGMGIDKDNVRFVLHYSPPISLENYYQEIGRAGRDGRESKVILFWNEQEIADIDDILYTQIPNKQEFLRIVSSLYSKFHIAEAEKQDNIFQLNLKNIQEFTKLSYAKIKNVLNFLHNQEVVFWNNYPTLSTLELKLKPNELECLSDKDAYFVELLYRTLAGVGTGKISFNEKTLTNKFGVSRDDVVKRIKDLEQKGYLEYIDGNEHSIKFLVHRNDREISGKYWNVFEKIQKNKLQKWEELKFFIKNQDFCKMTMILSYFGEKNAEKCGKCYICSTAIKGIEGNLSDDILKILKEMPMTFDEIRAKMYLYNKEEVFESLISLLNLNKIKMLNYKTYIINE